MEVPYVEVRAYDVTNPEASCVVRLTVATEGLPISDVGEQEVVDAVKAVFAQQPNISVTASRYYIAATPV
ncbi:hypothetical protein [Streptomyces sp. NBC_00443]|uniref:hypothetical protein n=1 Tax=Streptomyces sp. NBC_00443 TaxID=2975743 RepID=UPI002E22614E